MTDTDELAHDTKNLPPPHYHESASNLPFTYALYRHTTDGIAGHPAAVRYVLYDQQSKRWSYVIRVPKKREGWKADVCAINEKDRNEPRYEVRREPLSRKFDFRPTNGVHNVMLPSTFQAGPKSFTIEAHDGQKLIWRRRQGSDVSASLISLPSNTVLAHYTSTPSACFPRTRSYDTLDVSLCGTLDVAVFPDSARTTSTPFQRQPSLRSNASSSSSSDAGPRIHRAHRQPGLGFCAPGVIAGAIASPHSSAAMNRNCIMGDELSNLGRVSLKSDVAQQVFDNAAAVQAAYWAEQNRATSKNKDPRPRAVDMDLLVSSLIAVIAG